MGCGSSILPIAGTAIGSYFGGPIGGAIGGQIGGAIGGGGGSTNGIANPSAPSPNVYQPKANTWADTTAQGQIKTNIGNNPFTAINPQLAGLLNSLFNNPYSAGNQTSANNAGAALTGAGGQAITAANNLYGQVGNDLGAARNVLNTAFDPQSSLYNRTLQQLQDQIRTGEAARGITSGGVGQDIEDQALSNFNIDWQNNLLSRETQGLQSASGADVNSANIYGQAGNLAGQGAGYLAQGGNLPYATYTGNLNDTNTSAGAIAGNQAQSNTINQQNIADLLQYLGLGINAGTDLSKLNVANFSNQQSSATANQNAIGSLLSRIPSITNAFSSGGGGGAGIAMPGSSTYNGNLGWIDWNA